MSDVVWHTEEQIFSGAFFELPEGFEKWHRVGERLGFDPEDAFDWMIVERGAMWGGHTIRVTRQAMQSEEQRQEYDSYIGVTRYETGLPIGRQ
ncbi:MAG: DUF2314 domain-containing protein [Pseudomonadales bacterium]